MSKPNSLGRPSLVAVMFGNLLQVIGALSFLLGGLCAGFSILALATDRPLMETAAGSGKVDLADFATFGLLPLAFGAGLYLLGRRIARGRRR